jgi:hypothetical protein
MKEFVIKLIILLVCLFFTNPDRALLDKQFLDSSKYSFVKGMAKYWNYTFKDVFGGDSVIDCQLFSYLNAG